MKAIDLYKNYWLEQITLLTLSILIGLLLSMKYNPVRNWPHRRVNTVKLHNWTAYAALAVSVVHPLVILSSKSAHFKLVDIVYPPNAPKQPIVNTVGALALYLIAFTMFTSYFRFEIGRKLWKPLHLVTYLTFPLFAVHAVLTDPKLKDSPIDFLDGEKVFVELCVVLVAMAIGYRVRWQMHRPPPRVHRPKQRALG